MWVARVPGLTAKLSEFREEVSGLNCQAVLEPGEEHQVPVRGTFLSAWKSLSSR